MARILPFRALRFSAKKFPNPALVIAPPYDVISPEEWDRLAAEEMHNIVHLDLPRGDADGKYIHAKNLLDAWLREGALVEDSIPALYRYEQTFAFDVGTGSRQYIRKGFFALIELSPFADRVVLPHEHTLSGPKVDRYKLISTTQAHFSQVFSLYRDSEGQAERALEAATQGPALVDATTPDGCRHRLWAVTDEAVIAQVTQVLAPKQVLIADGHHRYETMVAIRDAFRPNGVAKGHSQVDFAPMFFARAEDPGLLVLPTHRMVRNVSDEALSRLAKSVAPWFEVVEGAETTAAELSGRLRQEGESTVTLAMRRAGQAKTLWLRLRKDANLSHLGPATLSCLDVSVLHGLILEPILGIGAEAMAKQQNLTYSHELAHTLAQVEARNVQAAFLMNPTKVHQVLDACEAGSVLPQKSTYFQPKLATGLVMQLFNPGLLPDGV
jgi:uncharacterized protein (DUF1015 family)